MLKPLSGWEPLFAFLSIFVLGQIVCYFFAAASEDLNPFLTAALVVAGILCALIGIVGLFGCMPVQPNEARVLLLFGAYRGSVHESGFYWVNPFFRKRKFPCA